MAGQHWWPAEIGFLRMTKQVGVAQAVQRHLPRPPLEIVVKERSFACFAGDDLSLMGASFKNLELVLLLAFSSWLLAHGF
jgi:hypothetical protein